MDRRTFLGMGAGAGGLVLLADPVSGRVPGVALSGFSREPDRVPDLGGYLEMYDAGMDRIAESDFGGRIGENGRNGVTLPLLRGAVRSLYATAMLGDLSVHDQVDPQVQARLHAVAPEVDSALGAMERYVEARTSSEWVDLQLALRERDNPALEVASALTSQGAMLGLSQRRRLQTRALFTHASLQMRARPPLEVAGEYRQTLERARTSSAIDALAHRRLAASRGELAFELGSPPSVPVDDRTRNPGLRTMGWGVVIFSAGVLIVAVGFFPGVFVSTVGAIVLVIGLIQALAHAVVR